MKKFFNKLWHNIKLFFGWLFSGRELIELLVWFLQVLVIAWLILLGYTLAGGDINKTDYNVVSVDTISMEWVEDEYPKEWPIGDYIVSAVYEYDENKSLMFDNNKKLYDKSFNIMDDIWHNDYGIIDSAYTDSGRGRYGWVGFGYGYFDTSNMFDTLYFNKFYNDSYLGLAYNLGVNNMDIELDYFAFGNNLDDLRLRDYAGALRDINNSFYRSETKYQETEQEFYIGFKIDSSITLADIEAVQGEILLNFVNAFEPRIYFSNDSNDFLNDVAGGLMSYGYASGYRFGYSMGQYEFENQDYQDGYTEGWNASILENKDHWVNTGVLMGYQDGYAIGKQDGYDIGFPEGQATDFGFTTLLASVFVGVGSFLSINILPNISIGAIIAVPIVFGIIYFIIGRRKGD